MKARTGIFSTIYMWVGILSLVVQVLGTGRIIKGIGVGPALAILPLVFVIGFTGLMFTSALFAVAAFQACQRASNFGIANVAREALWPVVSREEKFKAKNIVDGAVFRGADFVNAFIYTGLARAVRRAAGDCRHRRGAGRGLGRAVLRPGPGAGKARPRRGRHEVGRHRRGLATGPRHGTPGVTMRFLPTTILRCSPCVPANRC